ncbi:Cell division protein FtsI/penicillin-binding protein 2 [Salinibacillus kushneri]|uniref:serine-type D-Ala-D-Ala carboxypeptidase n=1 Tax=Salinibacillus kushneri TaxID=237682 RepID=A0A1I0G5C5_9BACI|nr:penicillin-binding protein 2 [Salinibacillus kushneri]SET66033.1 Cell division protein FtsI/penicillin-binding protein 2 [Salinibacillus kushneri]
MKKRLYVLLTIVFILFSILVFRLADIQLFSTRSFGPENVNLLERSVAQRSHQMVLSTGRGQILSRNGERLTNKKVLDVIIFPKLEAEDTYKKLANVLDLSSKELQRKIKTLEQPAFITDIMNATIQSEQFNQLEDLELKGVQLIERFKNEDPALAQHLLGFVRENPALYNDRYGEEFPMVDSTPVGISGLQKAFDPFLIANEQEKLLFHVDGHGRPMFGFDLKYAGDNNHFYPAKIKTTLDLSLQQKAEKLFDEYEISKGGLVLLDVKSRDVLAMVSRPKVDKKNPYHEDRIRNQMITAHFPGSVFKTVVAAAAIEKGLVDEQRTFNCSQGVYGEKEDKRDLGELNFEQSFAQSCNRTFGQLALELMENDEDVISQYANKLGILGPVGWNGDIFRYDDFTQIPGEETGNIWGDPSDRQVEDAILQTAIGQKNVKVTPLAVANMMANIVNNGKKQKVRVVDQILYQNDATMGTFTNQKEEENEQINPLTAKRLQSLLKLVTQDSGTANELKELPISGKTGTAEMNSDGDEDNELENSWFAGYFPDKNPKYAMVAVDLQHHKGSKTKTLDIYKKMTEAVLQTEEQDENE